MTFTPYQKATAAAKEAVIEALKIDEDTKVLSELWRHYLGLRAIEQENLHHDKSPQEEWTSFNLDTTGTIQSSSDEFGYDPFTTEMNFAAAGPVNIPGGLYSDTIGQDAITFS